jgi:hypothetical protein
MDDEANAADKRNVKFCVVSRQRIATGKFSAYCGE